MEGHLHNFAIPLPDAPHERMCECGEVQVYRPSTAKSRSATSDQFTVTGVVAAAGEEYGPHAIVVLLDGRALPRKFKAAEHVRVTALGP